MNSRNVTGRRLIQCASLVVFMALVGGLTVLLTTAKKDPNTAGPGPGSGTASLSAVPPAASPGSPSSILVSNQIARTVAAPAARGSRQFDLAVNPYAAGLREPGKSKRAWESDFLERHSAAVAGDPIQFELTGGIMASGIVQVVHRDEGGIKYLSGSLSAPESGKFFFLRPPAGGRAGSAVGVIEFPASQTAYRIEPTGDNGAPELWQRRLDEVICLAMQPVDETKLNETEQAPPLRPDLVPEYIPGYNSNIVSLQSLPGARGVVLLDFFGGFTDEGWGNVYYSAPNVGNAAIRDVWKRVAEDYMPLNINVTTDLKVYEAAPEGSRQRCVIAPDAPTAAGVAYYGSWNWSGDTVCWCKYTSGKASAEVIAHEVGHTVGLSHQTQDFPDGSHNEYYAGHNGPGNTGWAPIMGAGYYQPVTSWAKGEFINAGQHEDELAIMTTYNDVAYRADDAGDMLATSKYLEIYSNATASAEGVIQNTGDADAFQFATSGGTANLSANVVGDWSDLGLLAEIQNSSGITVASNNPQNALSASISTSLAAGTYTFKVTGAGRNSPLTNGFSNYASLGYYSITGSVAGATMPSRFSIPERSPNGTVVGTVAAVNPGMNPLAYTITGGNANNAFAIDNNGQLTVANSAALIYANLAYGTQLTVQYELFVNITNSVDPLQTELNRRVVIQILDVPEPATKMIHRWSFNDGSDSVGGANATLVGSASYSVGKLLIPGSTARANCASVNLNNTLATNTSLTIEGWFTMNALQDWSKVWMFGRANSGNEPGLAYLDFTPRTGASGNVPSMSLNTGVRSFELNTRTGDNLAALTTGVEYHVACVYDAAASVMSLYLNGALVDSASMVQANITQLAANEAYFGAAVNYGDPNLNGAINELRIYNGPQTPLQLAMDYAAGPNTVVTNPGALLTLRLVVPNTNMVSLATQAVTVYADYANVTNVNVTTAGTVFTTGNSNVVAVTSPGFIRAFAANTTLLTASFGGTNVSRSLTVTNPPTMLAHRWSFSSGTDSISGSNATLVGTAVFSGGKLLLPGGLARSNCASVNITGTFNTTANLSIETWFTITNQQDWAKLWMFGRAAQGAGDPWLAGIEFSPRAGVDGNVPSLAFNPNNGNEVNTRGGSNPALLTTGGSYYVVATYDAGSNLMSLYVNGTLADSAPMGNGNITQINPDEAYFGAPVNYNDPGFNGAIDEMRIWKGAVSASQVLFNSSVGPNTVVNNPGTLAAVRLLVATNTMARGTSQAATVYADFSNYPNLNITTAGATYSSSNPGVVTVSAAGVIKALGAGTATVTASYGSTNDSKVITVIGAPVLAHRWSFDDLTDSVGGANATLVGLASLSGGKLQIPGGAARVNAATVNLTNTLAANPSLTIEGWFTMASLQNWSKVWMFGQPNGGAEPGLSYVDFTPRRGDGTSVPSISLNSALATEFNTSAGANPSIMSAGVEYQVAAVYNAASNTMSLYINGALADSASMNGGNITQLQATEAWFGASVYWPDSNLNGAINELRIWDGPLTAAQIAADYQLGPNQLPRPALNVVTAGRSLAISWPETFPGYTVQSSPVLGAGAVWTPVTTAPVLAGGIYTVSLPATNAAAFYRLTQ